MSSSMTKYLGLKSLITIFMSDAFEDFFDIVTLMLFFTVDKKLSPTSALRNGFLRALFIFFIIVLGFVSVDNLYLLIPPLRKALIRYPAQLAYALSHLWLTSYRRFLAYKMQVDYYRYRSSINPDRLERVAYREITNSHPSFYKKLKK